MSVFKTQATMRELTQRLELTMPAAVITNAQDADGFQAIKIVNGSDVAFAKIVMYGNAGRVDGLGLPQRSYSPHICQLLLDSSSTTISSMELAARVTAATAKLGMKIAINADTHTVLAAAPASAFDATYAAAAYAVANLPSDEINPLIMSQ